MAVKSTTDCRLREVLIKHASKIDLAFAIELNQYTYRFNYGMYFNHMVFFVEFEVLTTVNM